MEEEKKVEVQDLVRGVLKITVGGGDYKPLPVGEQLHAHIGKVGTAETLNFDKTEMVNKLVVPFVVDEPEGAGQTYSKWYTPSLHPKSTLSKVAVAVFGELPAEFDPVDLEGKPVRIILKDYERDGVKRQTVDSVFPPAKDQKVVAPKEETIEDFDMDAELSKAGV